MAFTTGTATDYHDLLDKLRLYLVAQGWTQLQWDTPASITDQARLSIRGPGAGAGREVYLHFRSWADPVAGYYNWECRGSTGWDAGAPFDAQPGTILDGGPTHHILWQNSINYWFYVNDRRVIVVTKVNTVYTAGYYGFFLPWGLPAEYPFPLIIGGQSQNRATLHTHTNTAFRNFFDPGSNNNLRLGEQAVAFRRQDGTWRKVANHTSDSSSVNNPAHELGTNNLGYLWPYHNGAHGGTSNDNIVPGGWPGSTSGFTTGGALQAFRPTAQGERPLFPVELGVCEFNGEIGALDGVYGVPGFGLTSETVLTIAGQDYRVFQNVYRTAGNSFVAIREV